MRPVRRPVVTVVRAAGAVLDLQRGVVDPETVVQAMDQPIEEPVVVVVAGTHQVGGQRDFPGAERFYERVISLPIYPGMTGEETDYVIESIKDVSSKHRK